MGLVCSSGMKKGWKLLIALGLPLAVAATAGYFTVAGVGSWYQTILRPAWNPPNWVFGPVWTVLYLLMGLALYLVWIAPGSAPRKRTGIALWGVQLAANFCWSLFFFNLHRIGTALADLALLWLLILLTIFAFARIDKRAAWLLVPYISWVSFAGILNFTIWMLN